VSSDDFLGLGLLFRQASACTRFCATTVAVHTLEKQDAAMVKDMRKTGKK